MSTLRERMDRLREVFTAQVSAEIKAVMSGATEGLCASDTLPGRGHAVDRRAGQG